MADDATDSAFGIVMFFLILGLIAYAAGTTSSSPSAVGTTSGTSQSLPPLAGSEVASCPSTFAQPKNDKTDASQTVTLKVYVDPSNAGRKCATASTVSAGTVKVTLAYTSDPGQMVSGMANQASAGPTLTASVQVSGTDNYCVSAVASRPGTPAKVIIPKVVEPCTLTAPAMHSASPRPRPTPSDDKEEGY
jgi:hypothetical protein